MKLYRYISTYIPLVALVACGDATAAPEITYEGDTIVNVNELVDALLWEVDSLEDQIGARDSAIILLEHMRDSLLALPPVVDTVRFLELLPCLPNLYPQCPPLPTVVFWDTLTILCYPWTRDAACPHPPRKPKKP